jgi:hypothetical protein
MLSERDIELSHPDAFDFAFGNLPSVKRAEFNRHLSSCPHCQKVIDEYSEIGQVIKLLPPHAEPAPDLEDRTVAAMVAALAGEQAEDERPTAAEDRTATRVYPIPEVHHPAEPETQVQPRPQLQPRAEDDTGLRPSPVDQPAPAEPPTQPAVTRLPVWRRYPRRVAAVVAAAAATIIAAIVVPLSLVGSQLTVVTSLHATAAAKEFGIGGATGRATARQVGESWTFDLSVHGLKTLPDNEVYVCWWAAPGSTKLHPVAATGGSFVVDNSGSASLTMTTGVDPRDFRTMEITAEPLDTGALHGDPLLTGQSTST